MQHAFKLFDEDLNKYWISSIRAIGPEERSVIGACLPNILEYWNPAFPSIKDVTDCFEIEAIQSISLLSRGPPSAPIQKYSVFNMHFFQQLMEFDGCVVQPDLNHFGQSNYEQ